MIKTHRLWLAAGNQQRRLRRLAPGLALLQQLRAMNQTAAAVGPHSAGTHHSDIRPGQSLLEHTAITGATQLGRTPCRECQPTIEADRQDQPHNARCRGQGTLQTAATVSKDAGIISS